MLVLTRSHAACVIVGMICGGILTFAFTRTPVAIHAGVDITTRGNSTDDDLRNVAGESPDPFDNSPDAIAQRIADDLPPLYGTDD